MRNKQVLIIGAGASFAYGFPLSDDLFRNIQTNYVERSLIDARKVYGSDNPQNHKIVLEAKEYVALLNKIFGVSIDKYLNINPSQIDHGLKSIIISIASKEHNSSYPGNEDVKDDWIKYLFQKMISGLNSYEEFLESFHSNLIFITFNYDRSMEYYFYNNLKRLFASNKNIDNHQINQIMQTLKIYHVYGKIGKLEWEDETDEKTVLNYGDLENIVIKSEYLKKQIRLIYTDRNNSQNIQEIQREISGSSRLLFLGFGYDADNIKILGLEKYPKQNKLFGTAIGLSDNEIQHIKIAISGNIKEYHDNIRLYNNYNCTMLLKEHLLVNKKTF